jgi:hypothetical protein
MIMDVKYKMPSLHQILSRKLIPALLAAVILLLPMQPGRVAASTSAPPAKVFLPLVRNGNAVTPPAASKLLGIYMQQYWNSQTVPQYMPQADTLAGKKHTVSGWFISLQDIAFTSRQPDTNPNNFYTQLEALWNGGYISFINLMSAASPSAYEVTDNCTIPFNAYQVASGSCDAAIQRMADLYSAWVGLGGGRKAFIAPLPEMNGVMTDGSKWTSYAGDAGNFKLAYQKFLTIFASRGVQRSKVWWVFAPNGWSTDAHKFEFYYPGDTLIDVIGFSSYNYGYCPVALTSARWENYDTLYQPYIARINTMAGSKPILIVQTGSTALYQSGGGTNVAQKNTWLKVNYEYLAAQPSVLGVLYFDIDQSAWECNWSITTGGPYSGYHDGAAPSAFGYLTSQNLNNLIP